MIMFVLAILFFIGAAFLTLAAGALAFSSVWALLGVVALLWFIWWLSGRGGRPATFWPNFKSVDVEQPRRRHGWGPNHISSAKGRTSLDDPFD